MYFYVLFIFGISRVRLKWFRKISLANAKLVTSNDAVILNLYIEEDMVTTNVSYSL